VVVQGGFAFGRESGDEQDKENSSFTSASLG